MMASLLLGLSSLCLLVWSLRQRAAILRLRELEKIRLAEGLRSLAAAGSDKTKLLSATIYLTDLRSFADMNAEWDAWISHGNAPARATVEAKLASPDYQVEIAVIAAV